MRFRSVGWLAISLLFASMIIACSGPETSADPTHTATTQAIGTPADGDPTNTAEQASTEPVSTEQPAETPAASTATTQPGDPTTTPGPPPTATEEPSPTVGPSATPQPPIDLSTISLSVEQVGSGFSQPVLLTHAGDGSGRRFVLEKTGSIRLLDGSVYLDISDRVLSFIVRSEEHELGLLGLAFHPDFENNRTFFVHYTDLNQDHVISRFVEGDDGRADASSETILLTYDQPDVNFVGGTIIFGSDGYLYIGMGAGTSDDSRQIVTQELDNLYGKILRIDVDNGEPYGIPADNPFVGTPGARGEIWAYGLRNPWRISFDRATGDLYIGSPGEFAREWINFQPAGTSSGRNYGWPYLEGGACWELWPGECVEGDFELPIYVRPTYQDGNCVILGGFVYRGTQSPALNGVYFFSDYCSGRIWGLARDASGTWQSAELYNLSTLVSSFGEDESGEVYVFGIEDGIIYRLVAD